MNKRKIRTPKTRAEFEEALMNAFMAGCTHGYAVEHTGDICEQEKVGALWWVGRITLEERNERLKELRNG